MLDPFKNIDKELLISQKEELFKGVLNKGHVVDSEVLEGVLGLLDAVTDNVDTINNTELCECSDCGYIGNTAIWRGDVIIEDGQRIPIEGPVKLIGGTFDLDSLSNEEEKDDIDSFDGDYCCPICRTSNIY